MRSMMFLGPGRLELREVPVPQPGPGEILVRVRAATTCGTDVKTFRRGHPKVIPPTPFGHEFAGDVAEAGAGVTRFQRGMRVVAHNTAPCNSCYYCKHGQENLCDNLIYNFGTFGEYLIVPEPIARLNAFEIPDHLSYSQASILEPLVSVVHAHRLIRIQPGEVVAIIGAGGPIGLMHLQMALRSGASKVFAVDLSENRLAAAKALGATALIQPPREDPVEAIRQLTGGRGVDVSIESAGAVEAWETALRVVRKGGRVNWFGGLKAGANLELDTQWVHYGELTLLGTYHGTPLDVLHAFELIASGVIDTRSLVSREMPLERLEEAFDLMSAGKVIKVAINPDLPAN